MSEMRVLFIDDEEELVSTLVERLSYRGIESAYAIDGHEGLAKMKEGRFDIVVLDLKLPGLGGEEVLRRLRRDYPRVPVLLITGHGSPITDVESRPEGAYDYLIKPVNLDDLIAKMREALAAQQ